MNLKDIVSNNKMAKFSHFIGGNLYYKVESDEGIYQFPVKTIEKIDSTLFKLEAATQTSPSVSISYKAITKDSYHILDDIGMTTFDFEMKAIYLMRWIKLSISNDEIVFIKKQ